MKTNVLELLNRVPADVVTLLNADGASIFADDVEHVLSKAFDVLYAPKKFRLLFNVNTEANAGATSIMYRVYDKVGIAKIIANYANDLPQADVSAKEVIAKVKTVASSFSYNRKEILSSQLAGGQALDVKKAQSALDAVEEKHNKIALLGDADYAIVGLLTHPNIPTGNVPNGVSGFSEWDQKTPDEIIEDINSIYVDMIDLTNEVEVPTHLALPSKQRAYIATKRIVDQNMTIMQYLLQNIEWLASAENIISVPELKGAGTGGADVMFGYKRDAMKLEYMIAEEADARTPQVKNLAVQTPVTAETAGLFVYFPLSISIKEGI